MSARSSRFFGPVVLLLAASGAGCGSDSDSFSETGGAPSSSGGSGGSPASSGGSNGNASGGQTANSGGALASGGSTSTSGGSSAAGAGTSGASNAGEGGEGGAPEGGAASSTGGETASGGATPAGSAGNAGSGAAGGSGELDPPPGEYGERADLLESNSEMAVAEAAGKIYVIGGYPSSPSATVTTVLVYDPALDSWDYAEPLPEPIHHPVAVGVAGKVYSLGGQTPGDDTDRTLVYDPASGDGWLDLPAMPTARGAGAAAVIDDKIYVVGGRPPADNQFEVYDIGDETWDELEPLPGTFAQRNHLIATAIGGLIYVAGGRYDGGGFGSPRTASLDVYDPELGQWDRLADMPRERGGVNGIAANGCFFVWGGEGSMIGEPNDVFPDHDFYNPLTDTWTPLEPLPTPIHGVTGAAFLDGIIYIPGGGTQSGGSSGSTIFQVYRPDVSCE